MLGARCRGSCDLPPIMVAAGEHHACKPPLDTAANLLVTFPDASVRACTPIRRTSTGELSAIKRLLKRPNVVHRITCMELEHFSLNAVHVYVLPFIHWGRHPMSHDACSRTSTSLGDYWQASAHCVKAGCPCCPCVGPQKPSCFEPAALMATTRARPSLMMAFTHGLPADITPGPAIPGILLSKRHWHRGSRCPQLEGIAHEAGASAPQVSPARCGPPDSQQAYETRAVPACCRPQLGADQFSRQPAGQSPLSCLHLPESGAFLRGVFRIPAASVW